VFWTNAKRVLKAGIQSFFRSGFVSVSSLLVMTITLFIIGSLFFLGGFLNYNLDIVKEKVDVNVYFVTTAQETDILAIKKSLEVLPEVSSVEYVSRDQALINFKEKHKTDDLTLQAIDELGDNPLGALLNVKAKDPSQYAGIAGFLDNSNNDILSPGGAKIIDKINYAQNKLVIDKLTAIINSANMIGFWLAIIFVFISLLITFNTIRLVIFMKKDEISVMRLVGASHKYVKGPFVVNGILCGLISAFITILIFSITAFWISHSSYGIYFGGFNLFSYLVKNILLISVTIFGTGIVLGTIASYFAVHKYLRN
jgi:cell division transport system permease protein